MPGETHTDFKGPQSDFFFLIVQDLSSFLTMYLQKASLKKDT